ncbi:MAG: hypothetical protein QXH30_02970 [Candidatus Bilamarchaeaceae archaeon]
MMGRWLLFFLALVSFFALHAYADPPLAEVDSHNIGIAGSLMGTEGLAVGKLTSSEPGKVNMTIVGALPQVDNKIPSDVEGILWAWNEKNADGMTISEEGSDGCTDYYYPALIGYSRSAVMRFSFRNETRAITLIDYGVEDEAEGREMETDPIVGIPFSFEELETANGTENLTVELQWEYHYSFEVPWSDQFLHCEDDGHGGQSCSCQSETFEPLLYWNTEKKGNVSREFIVESGRASFFLVRPVLGEQWYENDHFDTLIFSRKSIYKAEISMGGNKTASAQIYNFTVLEDPLGAWHIFSNEIQDSGNASMAAYELSYWANPVVKEEMPFSHLYEVNHTYEGWGPQNMSIEATDFFLGKHKYGKEIYGRKATRWGASETGEPAGGPEYYRPGKEEPEERGISHNILPPAAMGMLVLLIALASFMYYKRWGASR